MKRRVETAVPVATGRRQFIKALAVSGLMACALPSLGNIRPAAAQNYNVISLGKDLTPYAVNDMGQVVGSSRIGPFLWSQGRLILLHSSTDFSKATAINSRGDIVGVYNYKDGSNNPVTSAFLRIATSPNSDGGTFIDLNSTLLAGSGWTLHFAHDINDDGKIVGEGTYTDSSGTYQGMDFLWEPVRDGEGVWTGYGAVRRLPMGPSRNENPSALNNLSSPQVAGSYDDEGGASIYGKAFIWQGGSSIDLGNIDGASYTQAFAINDWGQAVGNSDSRAFLWTPGGTNGTATNPQMQNLHPSKGISQSRAFSINNHGLVTGEATYTSNGQFLAFSWDSVNRFRDLNSYWINKPSGTQLTSARGCNNKGQIVAYGYVTVTTTTKVGKKITTTTTKEYRGFLLTPQ